MAYIATSIRRAINYSPIRRCATNEFDLGYYMSTKIERINIALDAAVPLRAPVELHESMRHTLLARSKRVCSSLTLASCELLGGAEHAAMPAACAVEMIVAMSLILDDLPCMDDDDFRRGQPSNHVKFGEDISILAAGTLLSHSFEHVAERSVGVPPDRVVRMVAELAKGLKGAAVGQVADLKSGGKEIKLEELEYIHEHKTAKLAEAAAVCGAIAGGGTEEEVESVRRYARCVGLAHQVIDDIVDMTASSEELGKTAGKDVASDKATYPKLVGVERARNIARELGARAEEELAGFDPVKAEPLFHLARFIANRK